MLKKLITKDALNLLNRVSLSGGTGTSAEVSAITTSSPGHNGFNIPSVGALDPLQGIIGNVAAQIPELSQKKCIFYEKDDQPMCVYIKYIHKLKQKMAP
uniref:Uncharacterized protein n=1 Tax=Brassica oleracea var. oleracea TaxID=109376 RepID=A0A0D3EGE1_BRAOL